MSAAALLTMNWSVSFLRRRPVFTLGCSRRPRGLAPLSTQAGVDRTTSSMRSILNMVYILADLGKVAPLESGWRR